MGSGAARRIGGGHRWQQVAALGCDYRGLAGAWAGQGRARQRPGTGAVAHLADDVAPKTYLARSGSLHATQEQDHRSDAQLGKRGGRADAAALAEFFWLTITLPDCVFAGRSRLCDGCRRRTRRHLPSHTNRVAQRAAAGRGSGRIRRQAAQAAGIASRRAAPTGAIFSARVQLTCLRVLTSCSLCVIFPGSPWPCPACSTSSCDAI